MERSVHRGWWGYRAELMRSLSESAEFLECVYRTSNARWRFRRVLTTVKEEDGGVNSRIFLYHHQAWRSPLNWGLSLATGTDPLSITIKDLCEHILSQLGRLALHSLFSEEGYTPDQFCRNISLLKWKSASMGNITPESERSRLVNWLR